MTPLHILAMNPHANSGAIMACFQADMNVMFVNDRRENTPFDYLEEYNLDGYSALITSLYIHREAMQSASHL